MGPATCASHGVVFYVSSLRVESTAFNSASQALLHAVHARVGSIFGRQHLLSRLADIVDLLVHLSAAMISVLTSTSDLLGPIELGEDSMRLLSMGPSCRCSFVE